MIQELSSVLNMNEGVRRLIEQKLSSSLRSSFILRGDRQLVVNCIIDAVIRILGV